ncbi:MAG: nuclear transport factor 2 family protein [Pyrinomonadaceae bacterium]|nr:nuclear transport factor 2 family protein [Pyrinomonadaceae bacterium]
MRNIKQISSKFFVIILAVSMFAIFARAQVNYKNDEKIKEKITRLRRQVVEAIEKRDRRTLEDIYAEDFSHTHASGKVDDRKTRIETFVSGDKTFETARADDLKLGLFGERTVVATGKSSVTGDDGKAVVYRWTIVYAKIKAKWRIAASQATKLTEQ